jgi:hypothetical protein
MKARSLLRKLLERLSKPPFEGRWTPAVLESAAELDLADAVAKAVDSR